MIIALQLIQNIKSFYQEGGVILHLLSCVCFCYVELGIFEHAQWGFYFTIKMIVYRLYLGRYLRKRGLWPFD